MTLSELRNEVIQKFNNSKDLEFIGTQCCKAMTEREPFDYDLKEFDQGMKVWTTSRKKIHLAPYVEHCLCKKVYFTQDAADNVELVRAIEETRRLLDEIGELQDGCISWLL